MQSIKSRRRSSGAGASLMLGVPAEYTAKVSFYEMPPQDTVTLEEFETFAYDRLRGTCSTSALAASRAASNFGRRVWRALAQRLTAAFCSVERD